MYIYIYIRFLFSLPLIQSVETTSLLFFWHENNKNDIISLALCMICLRDTGKLSYSNCLFPFAALDKHKQQQQRKESCHRKNKSKQNNKSHEKQNKCLWINFFSQEKTCLRLERSELDFLYFVHYTKIYINRRNKYIYIYINLCLFL